MSGQQNRGQNQALAQSDSRRAFDRSVDARKRKAAFANRNKPSAQHDNRSDDVVIIEPDERRADSSNANVGNSSSNKRFHQSNKNDQDNNNNNHNNNHGGQRDAMDRDSRAPYVGPGAGAIKFIPGAPTVDLQQILGTEGTESVQKKFTGRCRLFVGNLPNNITEKALREMFEPFGEIGEVFLGPKNAFAFVKMDYRQNAEAARAALDYKNYEGRVIRVRLAAHAAAVRVKHLSPLVTNELLEYAFRSFGEVERAVIIVDDRGRSIGEGIVEFARKSSALYAVKKCQQENLMLTRTPRPVLVELVDPRDEEEGFTERQLNRNSHNFRVEREVGPRFSEPGTFEHAFATRWKELYEIERQKRERLEEETAEARRKLQEQVECARLEHDAQALRDQLKRMEDNAQKMKEMSSHYASDEQQREEQRRQHDLMLRQREEEVLRRQQLGDYSGLRQQETELRLQANALQDMLDRQEHALRQVMNNEPSSASGPQGNPFDGVAGVGYAGPSGVGMQPDQGPPSGTPQTVGAAQMNMMNGPPDGSYGQMAPAPNMMQGPQGGPHSYAEAAGMMNMNHPMGPQQHPQHMGMHAGPFGYMTQAHPQQAVPPMGPPMPMPMNPNYVAPPPQPNMGTGRPPRYVRPHNNNVHVVGKRRRV
ncbi:Hrp65 protein, partial [Fragariocoptes setiger]